MSKKNRALFAAFSSLFLFLCTPPPRTDATTAVKQTKTLAKLKINAGDVHNWFLFASFERPDSFSVYSPHEWTKISGEQRRPENLVAFSVEHMAGPGNNELSAFVLNMGSANFASALFRDACLHNSNHLHVSNFDPSVAFATPEAGGVQVIAHFSKFFVRLKFRGFDSQAQAAAKASEFLAHIKANIK